MKNIKIIGSLIVVIVIIAFYFTNKRENKNVFSNAWRELLNSNTAISETKNVEKLNSLIKLEGGYIELFYVNKEGVQENIFSMKDVRGIQTVNVVFHWSDKKYVGRNWTPIDKQNIYIFFRE